MANPYRAEVEVTIAGKRRRMVYNANSIAAIEEEAGEGVFALAEKLGSGTGAPLARILRILLWAGLAEARHGVTLQQVGRAMRFDEYQHYTEQCMRGILRSYGQDLDEISEKAEEADPLGPAEGNGEKENPFQTVEGESTSDDSDERPSLPVSVPTSSGG